MSDQTTSEEKKKEDSFPPAFEAKEAAKSDKKDSTIDLPMFDLEEALNFVSSIHEKALETLPMPDVAKGMGYTHPSSTPFYRRMVAARHFGLLTSAKAELTVRAKDYFKPDNDGVRAKALLDAVSGISSYQEEIQKYLEKKLNTEYVANSFSKSFNLTNGCANTCAKVFESSLRYAGLLDAEGTLKQAPGITAKPKVEQAVAGESPSNPIQKHSLPLSKDGKRVLEVTAPLDITAAEVRRIQSWIAVTLQVDWSDQEVTTPAK